MRLNTSSRRLLVSWIIVPWSWQCTEIKCSTFIKPSVASKRGVPRRRVWLSIQCHSAQVYIGTIVRLTYDHDRAQREREEDPKGILIIATFTGVLISIKLFLLSFSFISIRSPFTNKRIRSRSSVAHHLFSARHLRKQMFVMFVLGYLGTCPKGQHLSCLMSSLPV